MSVEEVEDIKEIFRKIDTDNDGIVSIEELKGGLQKFNSQLAESEVQMFIEAVSLLTLPFLVEQKLIFPNVCTYLFTHIFFMFSV